MKNRIEAIEKGYENKNLDWRVLGLNPTFGQAYLYSMKAGNDLPNFGEVIWDDEISEILENCRKTGTTEFTISSNFSSLIETIAEFQRLGCRMQGLVEIKSLYDIDWQTGKQKLIPAFLMSL